MGILVSRETNDSEQAQLSPAALRAAYRPNSRDSLDRLEDYLEGRTSPRNRSVAGEGVSGDEEPAREDAPMAATVLASRPSTRQDPRQASAVDVAGTGIAGASPSPSRGSLRRAVMLVKNAKAATTTASSSAAGSRPASRANEAASSSAAGTTPREMGTEKSFVAPDIATFVAHHGYSITDDKRIREGARLIAKLTEDKDADWNREAFGTADARDALIAMARKADTDESILWSVNAVKNIALLPSNTALFATVHVRDALLDLAQRTRDPYCVTSICQTITCLCRCAADEVPGVQEMFCTARSRDTIVHMGQTALLSHTTAMRWFESVTCISTGNVKCQRLFGLSEAFREMFIRLAINRGCGLLESAAAAARCLAALLSEDAQCVEHYSIDDVRHLLFCLASEASEGAEMCVLLEALSHCVVRLCSWRNGLHCLAHVDTLNVFILLAKFATEPHEVAAVCHALVEATRHKMVLHHYCSETLRHALLTMANHATSTSAAMYWCQALNNLANYDEMCRMLCITPIRQACCTVARFVGDDDAALWWACAVTNLTQRADHKQLFASVSIRTAVRRHVVPNVRSSDAAMWVGYCIYSVTLDDNGRRVWACSDAKEVLVSLAQVAKTHGAVEAVCGALATVTACDGTLEVDADEFGLIEDVVANGDVEKMFATMGVVEALCGMAVSATSDDAIVALCRVISNLTNNDSSRLLFSTKTMRNALLLMSRSAACAASAAAILQVIGGLTRNIHCRSTFAVPQVRSMMLVLAPLCTTATSVEAFGDCLFGVASEAEAKGPFGSAKMRDALVQMANRAATTPAAVARLCAAIKTLAVLDSNKRTFGVKPVRDAFLRLGLFAGSAVAVHEFCSALKILAVYPPNKSLLGASSQMAKVLAGLCVFATTSDAVRSLCTAVLMLIMDKRTRDVLFDPHDAFLPALVTLESRASISSTAHDAFWTLLRQVGETFPELLDNDGSEGGQDDESIRDNDDDDDGRAVRPHP